MGIVGYCWGGSLAWFALKYTAASVIGGMVGYTLAATVSTRSVDLVTGTLAGSTLGGLAYLLRHGVYYQSQSNYR